MKPESMCCVLRATCLPSVEGATWPLVSGYTEGIAITTTCAIVLYGNRRRHDVPLSQGPVFQLVIMIMHKGLG